jgi:uncharacterized cupin superfamily protein
MVPEAPLQEDETGQAPQGDGWFVVNARRARWLSGHFGAFTRFEGDVRFAGLGINIGVLEPGQPACYYHAEEEQEDFLVLSGECLLIIEGEERRLTAWDFVHCPSGTRHVFVGAGEGPCAILAVGTRTGGGVLYPADEVARRHRAGVEQDTHDPGEAYGGLPPDREVAFREEWLPR